MASQLPAAYNTPLALNDLRAVDSDRFEQLAHAGYNRIPVWRSIAADPTRPGYTFTGWDLSFQNITDDLTVTAQYEVADDGIFADHFEPKT